MPRLNSTTKEDVAVIASVDGGNGFTNGVINTPKGAKFYSFASVRASAIGQDYSLGGAYGEKEYEYVRWYGQNYVFGDDVVHITRRALERQQGVGRYGDEFHRWLIATSLAKLGVKNGEVDLITFCPPKIEIFREASKKIAQNLAGTACSIQLSSENEPRCWTYRNVTVHPEGVGAVACFLLDEKGQETDVDILAGEVVVLDSGIFTLDGVLFTDGRFTAEDLENGSWEGAGIETHIRQPILRKVHAKDKDFQTVTTDQIDIVIRQGLTTGDYSLTVAGKTLNLGELAQNLYMRYADYIANNIIDTSFNGLRGIRSLILVGGGAVMIENRLNELYPGKILSRADFPHTKKVHPVNMNAVGGLRIALSQRRGDA